MFFFTLVLLLEAIYATYLLVKDHYEAGVILILNKIAEFSSQIVMIHFVLELEPVLIILCKDTIKEMKLALKRFNTIYVSCICFAIMYTAALLIVLGVRYVDSDLYQSSIELRAVLYASVTCKLLFEVSIVMLFIYQSWRLYNIKRTRGNLTR
jgi:hypothetical protein